MRRMRDIILRFIPAVWLLLAEACSPQAEEPNGSEGVTPQIIFLFSPGGLGDMSYNDCILEGVQQFKKEHPEVDVFLYSPPTMEVAERIFSDWMKRPGSDIPVVFALASSDYEGLVDLYTAEYELTPNKRILLFESLRDYGNEQISTFQVSMYGASFLAGITAKAVAGSGRSLVLLGSSTDKPIESAKDGFIDGWGSNNYDVEYLAEDWTGFVMANATYQRMADWSVTYGFIFPVAGGSNMGLYRYTREYSDAPYLAGMDIDQSDFSTKIIGSVVKRFDRLVKEYFTDWLLTGEMPPPQIYGLESRFVDWHLSPLYSAELFEQKDRHFREAIDRENEYYIYVNVD